MVKAFTLSLSELQFVGNDLVRPASLVAEKDGTLWIADGDQGGVTRLNPDGTQALIGKLGGQTNGLAMDRQGDLLAAHSGALYLIDRQGRHERLLDKLDDEPLGPVIGVCLDRRERAWITVATRARSWFASVAQHRPDGYVILLDAGGPRIVADGLLLAGDVCLDGAEAYLYVAETMARRIVRFPIRPEGGLGERETYGPEDLGPGAYVQGLAFDIDGNLWVSTTARNGVAVLTPDGGFHTVFEEVNEAALKRAVARVEQGKLAVADFLACAGRTLQLPTGLAFGDEDRQTVYLGSLAMPHLVSFRAPLPGLPLLHWER